MTASKYATRAQTADKVSSSNKLTCIIDPEPTTLSDQHLMLSDNPGVSLARDVRFRQKSTNTEASIRFFTIKFYKYALLLLVSKLCYLFYVYFITHLL